MLEKYLQAGMSADWLPRKTAANQDGGLCNTTEQVLSVDGSMQTQYKFLPFAPNGINYVRSAGLDVLSGPFTGCTMAVYMDGQTRCVCHVSTGDGQDCKQRWSELKQGFKVGAEFKPSEGIKLGKGQFLSACYGLITTDNRCYSITVTLIGQQRSVVSIKKMKV